ncbi:MAG: RluA family pseudouridine synthase [Sporomusaceae bacterium]|nr:RluA family pseudouridine synthase [Sporomusaceae bacterium]
MNLEHEKQYDECAAADSLHFAAGDQGKRIDMVLTEQYPELTRTYIQKLIGCGNLMINGKVTKANYKLREGDQGTFLIPPPEELNVVAENLPLHILYEDESMIVINKARGMVVHPAPGNYNGTLVNALLYHCDSLSGINGVIRPGIVHRLDKDTSGVMVVAKTDQAHLSLSQQIQEKSATREYRALVHGIIGEEQGRIEAPIGRHPIDRKKMAVTPQNSKAATTLFTVTERFKEHSFVLCKLLTGRTHQIRVHMAYIGHPLVSDPLYGPTGKKNYDRLISGQALHSERLSLKHPVTGELMEFIAPMPDDMEQLLDYFRCRMIR